MKACEGGGVAPPRQEVSCVIAIGVWWNVVDAMLCVVEAEL